MCSIRQRCLSLSLDLSLNKLKFGLGTMSNMESLFSITEIMRKIWQELLMNQEVIICMICSYPTKNQQLLIRIRMAFAYFLHLNIPELEGCSCIYTKWKNTSRWVECQIKVHLHSYSHCIHSLCQEERRHALPMHWIPTDQSEKYARLLSERETSQIHAVRCLRQKYGL